MLEVRIVTARRTIFHRASDPYGVTRPAAGGNDVSVDASILSRAPSGRQLPGPAVPSPARRGNVCRAVGDLWRRSGWRVATASASDPKEPQRALRPPECAGADLSASTPTSQVLTILRALDGTEHRRSHCEPQYMYDAVKGRKPDRSSAGNPPRKANRQIPVQMSRWVRANTALRPSVHRPRTRLENRI